MMEKFLKTRKLEEGCIMRQLLRRKLFLMYSSTYGKHSRIQCRKDINSMGRIM